MEESREVKTVEIRYRCPHCKEGYMNYAGSAYSTYRTLYDHICDKCGERDLYETTYPKLSYQPIKS